MRSRPLLWCLGAGAFLLLAGFTVFVFVHVLPDRITPENFDRIRVGMRLEEVETIFGRPADFTVVNVLPRWVWVGEKYVAIVYHDQLPFVGETWIGEQADKWRAELGIKPPTFWDKLRRSLGW